MPGTENDGDTAQDVFSCIHILSFLQRYIYHTSEISMQSVIGDNS